MVFRMEDYHISTVIKTNLADIQGLQKNKGPMVTGLPTGFTHLDRITSGLNNSDLIILASCPCFGKTAFALRIARNIAVENDVPVLIFSLEDTAEQLSMPMLRAESRIESRRLRTGELDDNDGKRIKKASELLSKAPIYINATPGISISDIQLMTEDLKEDSGTCLVIIDYLQLIKGDSAAMKRPEALYEMTGQLKCLAQTNEDSEPIWRFQGDAAFDGRYSYVQRLR